MHKAKFIILAKKFKSDSFKNAKFYYKNVKTKVEKINKDMKLFFFFFKNNEQLNLLNQAKKLNTFNNNIQNTKMKNLYVHIYF